MADVGAASDNDNHARSIRTIVPHELESVEKDDSDQITRQEYQQWDEEGEEERRNRRAEDPTLLNLGPPS